MEFKTICPLTIYTTRLVKSEDLNHHGTLFAGRTAEWVVEAGFLSAAKLLNPKSIVCIKIHGMQFLKPVKLGQILNFTSKIVYTGTTSLTANIQVAIQDNNDSFVNGFITFIHVDENSKSKPHNITILPETEEDILLYEQAQNLKK